MFPSRNRGFTLIELVVVITILGILSAFAIPKFISLTTQARVATIGGLKGSVNSAAALARSMAMATNQAAAGTVTMENSTVQLQNFYPDSITGINLAVNTQTSDFTFTAGTATTAAVFGLVSAPAPATCSVSYMPATATTVPVVSTTTTGC